MIFKSIVRILTKGAVQIDEKLIKSEKAVMIFVSLLMSDVDSNFQKDKCLFYHQKQMESETILKR